MADLALSIRGVKKRFGDHVVLDGVDLEVERGQTCVVLGQSGSGKTVLLKVLIGLLPADEGTVEIDGEQVTFGDAVGLAELRKKLGILFQAGALFDSLSVRDNIAFPLHERTKLTDAQIAEKVERALSLVRLAGHGHKFPGELSGGMQKRAAFARAVVHDPKILLLDEPTAGLDPTTTELITDELIAVKTTLGSTTLAITYNLQSAFRMADTIALLHQGRIVAHAAPNEFKRDPHPAVQRFLKDWNERERLK